MLGDPRLELPFVVGALQRDPLAVFGIEADADGVTLVVARWSGVSVRFVGVTDLAGHLGTVVGTALGHTSPVRVFAPMFYLAAEFPGLARPNAHAGKNRRV